MSVEDAIISNLPTTILNSIRSIPSAYIMGGFIASVINGEPINDIDIFVAYDDFPLLRELMYLDEFKLVDTSYPSVSGHILKGHIDGLAVDVVVYNIEKFFPITCIDFLCRMVIFDGYRVIEPVVGCIDDIINKHLRFNYYRSIVPDWELKVVKKYTARGWRLI